MEHKLKTRLGHIYGADVLEWDYVANGFHWWDQRVVNLLATEFMKYGDKAWEKLEEANQNGSLEERFWVVYRRQKAFEVKYPEKKILEMKYNDRTALLERLEKEADEELIKKVDEELGRK